MPNLYYMDLETYSECPISYGSHAYAAHPSTELLLWAYAKNDEPVKLWDCTCSAMPEDLRPALEEIRSGQAQHVWHNGFNFDTVVLERLGYPLPLENCIDTMVLAYQCGMPGSLDQLCQIFKLGADKAKIRDGSRLISRFCAPRREAKTGLKRRFTAFDRPDDWEKFKAYCVRDVDAMRTIYKKLPKFNRTDKEKALQLLDAKVNRRGMFIDTLLAEKAIALAKENKARIDSETLAATNGAVDSVTKTAVLKDYLERTFGMKPETLAKGDVEKLLEDPTVPAPMKELLTKRLSGAKTSVAKYQRVLNYQVDNRLKGGLQFRGAARTGRYCLTGDHEVLSPQGWVRLDQWRGGRIAVWNKNSEAISFQESEAVSFDYEGAMYQYDTVRCAQISTPDHRMPYLNKEGFWQVATVEELAKMNRPKIPFTGLRAQPATLDHDKLRVLLMVQADGHFTEDGQLNFHFKKQRKIERCKSLLRKVEVPFVTYKYQTSGLTISVYARYVPLWLRVFREKEYGFWLLNESADIIFDELPHWDAYRCGPNSIQYSSCVKHNADLIQALACLSGRTATQIIKKAQKTEWRDAHVVNIWCTPGQGFELRDKPKKIAAWKGKVYCATTPTGFFLVRREGRVWITGNSGRGPQFQNLPRPSMSNEEIEAGIEAIKVGSVGLFYDDYSTLLSDAMRGLIIAPEGKKLCVADYSNVEGRVLAWLAGEQWKLQAFNAFDEGHGHDLYKVTYGKTFGVKPDDVTKKQRQIGKVEELALGYGGGAGAFAQFARLYGIDLDVMSKEVREASDPVVWSKSEDMYDWAKEQKLTAGLSRSQWIASNTVKQSWRDANPSIVKFWALCERAVRSAINNPGTKYYIRPDLYALKQARYLVLRLPSGRFLSYPLASAPDDGNITYYGVNQYSRKFEKIRTYGPKICIAKGTPVLTSIGWVPIEEVTPKLLVWDGEEFVNQEGAVSNGVKAVVEAYGAYMTPDHEVLTDVGWKEARFSKRYNRAKVRLPDCDSFFAHGKGRPLPLGFPMRLWKRSGSKRMLRQKNAEGRVPAKLWLPLGEAYFRKGKNPRNVEAPCLRSVALNEAEVRMPDTPCFQKLWRQGRKGLRTLVKFLRELLGGHGADVQTGPDARPNRREQRILPGKLPLGNHEGTGKQHSEDGNCVRQAAVLLGGKDRDRSNNTSIPTQPRVSDRTPVRQTGYTTEVFDLLNCGPRHRFVILADGRPLIVHNCENVTQSVACDLLLEAGLRLEAAGYEIVLSVHDEYICETCDDKTRNHHHMEKIMSELPVWAEGLPLAAAGFESYRYRK